MILAYHLILSAYGFWLPNDPRGSWSDFVRSWELHRHGPATQVTTHRSLAHQPHNSQQRQAAKQALRHPPVTFDGIQTRAIARGFAEAARESDYRIHACAVLPDHAHLILARHPRPIMQIISHLKARATQQLKTEGLHPMAPQARNGRTPSPWARSGWKVFIDRDDDVERAIRYVKPTP